MIASPAKRSKAVSKLKFSSFHLFHQHAGWSEREVFAYNVALIEYLEEMGFDGVWVAEHHFRDYGLCNNIPALLSFMAARTSKLRLGTGVIVLPLHNPVLVAEEIAQLDLLSDGRVDFGIGRGYQAGEFGKFGVDISEARDRFDEAVDLILKLWRDDVVNFDGKFYQCHDASLKPKPVQRPRPPTYVAAISPDTVKRVAVRGLPILGDPVATFRNLGRAAETWRTEMDANGFSKDGIDLCCMRTVYVAETNEKARADLHDFESKFDRSRIVNAQNAPIDPKTGQIAKGYEFWENRYLKGGTLTDDFRWDQLEVIGDPARVVSQIQTLQELGYTNIMCDFGSTRPMPLSDMRKIIKLFAEEVMPAFR
ncbi:MAG TPA: LLM class flavin-dependent oxidoreductase [Alphaproteobacteria bacterium]|nr:LLM class flavin-dependent oxidoreductase [Alphaproteobacteria bacterium]